MLKLDVGAYHQGFVHFVPLYNNLYHNALVQIPLEKITEVNLRLSSSLNPKPEFELKFNLEFAALSLINVVLRQS